MVLPFNIERALAGPCWTRERWWSDGLTVGEIRRVEHTVAVIRWGADFCLGVGTTPFFTGTRHVLGIRGVHDPECLARHEVVGDANDAEVRDTDAFYEVVVEGETRDQTERDEE